MLVEREIVYDDQNHPLGGALRPIVLDGHRLVDIRVEVCGTQTFGNFFLNMIGEGASLPDQPCPHRLSCRRFWATGNTMIFFPPEETVNVPGNCFKLSDLDKLIWGE